MPLIEIRYSLQKLHINDIRRVIDVLPLVSSTALTCPEGGLLKEEDIMIEAQPFGTFDKNCKELHIRILAHNYRSRLKRIDAIQDAILGRVRVCIGDVNAYVWLILAPTSYGSWWRL